MDALRIALADAQTAFSGEDDRHAALGWLAAHLPSLIAAQGQGLRDDGAPTVEELTREVQWAVIHAGYMSDDARRPDVLAWLLSHLSSLIADSAERATQAREIVSGKISARFVNDVRRALNKHPSDAEIVAGIRRALADLERARAALPALDGPKIVPSAPPHTGASHE